ncbi:MAG: urea ABC transporter permease subunit UrtB [Minwuia sp.]|uniref:urea ABC transporter permease subunit UrtB n=1 Tax=Minwuia sp. TaxID=2493630 RepID=UPI003A8A2B04
MMPRFLALFLGLCLCLPIFEARAEDLSGLVQKLNTKDYAAMEQTVAEIAATGDERAAGVLRALGDGDLYYRKDDDKVFIARDADSGTDLLDPLTREFVENVGRRDARRIGINNSLRRAIRGALGALTLQSPEPRVRRAAAASLFKSPDPEAIETLDAAIAAETDEGIRNAMAVARAASVMRSDLGEDAKLAAIETLADRGGRDVMALLKGVPETETEAVRAAAVSAAELIQERQELWAMAQNIYYGISLGSVLLMAAIGLAITFGVMGVINMAHGEMVMLGAYTTFVVQEIIRNNAPGLFEFSLLIAIPLAFLVSGAVGVAMERGIIRYLYGRALETLLATWGVSLILQQAVRSVFGPTNQEVGNPDFMSGAVELGEMTLTYNRIWIIVFSLVVLFTLMLVLRKTPLGLQMRAVTQNRRMAAAMGIRTDWVDAMTFGLGSGIAGIAGVALSQIDNVSPNLGQSYIIDSFMVVVFGGVGNLWGTLVAAMSLGVANKFLEPFSGAVLAKIFVLVFIILFIQKRPRGLFALKGRAVEA